MLRLMAGATAFAFVCNLGFAATPADNGDFHVLQPLAPAPQKMSSGAYDGNFYVPSTTRTVQWGYLPNNRAKPVLTVPSGSTVTFDTISHEGILEDQGRDPVAYFASKGVAEDKVLDDAIAITGSDMAHDFAGDGPHIVTGPVAVEGAEPGDVLKVEVVKLEPRVPYGVISNRHGKGALPGEYPRTEAQPNPDTAHPERYGNVSLFTPIEQDGDHWYGMLDGGNGRRIRFELHPFMGIMGVAPDTAEKVNSVPPMRVGGNADINDVGVGSTVYYPVAVPGAMFYTGDSHFAQGDGEVALTALEGSLRATLKLTLLKSGKDALPGGRIDKLLGETDDYWITVGLDPDLDMAMKDAVRESIRFLHAEYGIDESVALAYLSAATDFEVSQVVDKTKGIHALIRKSDFADFDAVDQPAVQAE
ncbi:acetamidase/formamidase family protein [Salinisphaera aquimarina]|uniref:Acetamidase/formamidase family protein n=1 Tax=Salinisphaera aquimarina TaxID=2094031 RepID=A0ABV7EX61_9GAMM